MAPDSDFVPGEMRWLVPGNSARLLDLRRTPVRIVELRPDSGLFICEVQDFEDRGALWDMPFESVMGFQFAKGSAEAPAAEAARYAEIAQQFDRTLDIPCDPARREESLRRLARLRAEAAAWLDAHSSFFGSGGALDFASREGDTRLWTDLEAFLGERDLWELEDGFATAYVSNPWSGERVKGHRIALAELGLAAYRGNVARDPGALEGRWSAARRAEHILARMAFVQELFARSGYPAPVLYRGLSTEGPLKPRTARSFVAATFSMDVALSLFGAPSERTGAMWRQAVPVERLFMTYLETRQMNRPFREAAAVMIEDPDNMAF
jgi:hypothetical protein